MVSNKEFDPLQTAKEIVEQTQKTCFLKHGFEIPLSLDFKLRGNSAAGVATSVLGDPNKNAISLSKKIIEQMSYTEIRDLIIHEFSHLLCKRLFPKADKPHGRDWKHCVYSLGGTNVSATYNSQHIKLKESDVLAKCKCDPKFRFISKRIADKIEKGGAYICTICHKRIKLAEEKDIIKFNQLKGI